MVITLQDICWLRQASRKRGAQSIPAAVITRLVDAHLIEADSRQACTMRTTKRGELALARLG